MNNQDEFTIERNSSRDRLLCVWGLLRRALAGPWMGSGVTLGELSTPMLFWPRLDPGAQPVIWQKREIL